MDDEYRVYKLGKDLDLKPDPDNPELFTNIFIKSKLLIIPFEGSSWPGTSVWIDFMNLGAHKFWRSLYNYTFFRGTDSNYGIWIDMNEPSVNNLDDTTMDKHTFHFLSNTLKVSHRDVHNTYGHMMAKATYEGLVERDSGELRPFVLSRSVFIGG